MGFEWRWQRTAAWSTSDRKVVTCQHNDRLVLLVGRYLRVGCESIAARPAASALVDFPLRAQGLGALALHALAEEICSYATSNDRLDTRPCFAVRYVRSIDLRRFWGFA